MAKNCNFSLAPLWGKGARRAGKGLLQLTYICQSVHHDIDYDVGKGTCV